jgi:hypothetical protein
MLSCLNPRKTQINQHIDKQFWTQEKNKLRQICKVPLKQNRAHQNRLSTF